MLQQNGDITKIRLANKQKKELGKILLDFIQHVLILISFLMFFSFVQVAMAEEENSNGLLLKSKNSDISLAAMMVKTDIDMRISGMINRTQVTQIFKNSSNEWAEGVYQFPLPDSAIVDTLRIQMSRRTIASEIKSAQLRANEQAVNQYQHAKKSGKRTALLEQHRPNLFSTTIANIAPGEEIRIEISFQYLAKFEQGEFKLRFPMAVVPRYIPGEISSEQAGFDLSDLKQANKTLLREIKRIRTPIKNSKQQAPISLHVELDAGFPLAELESRYHAIHKTNHGIGRYSIRFKFGAVLAKRDFELFWRPEPGLLPRTAMFHEQVDDEHYYFAMLYPQQHEQQPEMSNQALVNKEVIYVIDASGSMAGAPIRQARDALLKALKNLDPGDYFNIVSFNTKTHALFEQSRPASVLNVARARQFIALVNARGGTEMLPALKRALAVDESNSRLRQIIYLTDGAVVNEQTIFDLLRKEIKQNRLFTVGIGSSPNSYFLHRAARLGRGTFAYISDVNEISLRLDRLFKKINRPVLHDIKIEYPSVTTEVAPKRLPDLYEDEPVVFSMKSKEPIGLVNIIGYRSGEQWSRQLQLADSNNGFGIAKYWAGQTMNQLLSEARYSFDKIKLQKSITAVALKHGIMSPYTSMVAVEHSLGGDPSQKLKTYPIPVNLATNQGSLIKTSQVIPLSAKTATDAQLKLIIGLISLLLAVVVRLFLRRRYQNREWF